MIRHRPPRQKRSRLSKGSNLTRTIKISWTRLSGEERKLNSYNEEV